MQRWLARADYIHANKMLSNGMRPDEVGFDGLNIVEDTIPPGIIDVNPDKCAHYPRCAGDLEWKRTVIFNDATADSESDGTGSDSASEGEGEGDGEDSDADSEPTSAAAAAFSREYSD